MKLTAEQYKVYIEMLKEHERLRLSFNERHKRWAEYYDKVKGTRTETSFDMNKF
jgi:hypothetical protein